jgi:hypothetical protein
MIWELSNRGDQETRKIADRHYNRQKIGSPQFVPPGRCCVLICPGAFWVTSWPFGEYVMHRWPGAWVCSAFRREPPCTELASTMIQEALAATRWHFGDPPERGMITFIDRKKVNPVMVRGHKTWGRTWELAGFEPDGETVGGLLAFRIKPENIPAAQPPLGTTMELALLPLG